MDLRVVMMELGRVCCTVMLWHLLVEKRMISEIITISMIMGMLIESVWIYLISQGLILIKERIKYIFRKELKK